MNKLALTCIALVTALVSSLAPNLAADERNPSDSIGQTLYSRATQQSIAGPENWFTGQVQIESLFPATKDTQFSGATVTFSAGARTAWHNHPAGQHIVVIYGTARTGTRDGQIIEFGPGESVWCPPNIDHWHGATEEQAMKHLVVTGVKNGENVHWLEKVPDQIYRDFQE